MVTVQDVKERWEQIQNNDELYCSLLVAQVLVKVY